jgi:hypothetical protein
MEVEARTGAAKGARATHRRGLVGERQEGSSCLQGVGPAAAQQQAEAAGEGEAA